MPKRPLRSKNTKAKPMKNVSEEEVEHPRSDESDAETSFRQKPLTPKKDSPSENDPGTSNKRSNTEELNKVTTRSKARKGDDHINDQDEVSELKEKLTKMEQDLEKAENSKRVLYKALVRERNMNGEKPSVLMNEVSKTGHNFTKAYTTLSKDQKHERIRLLIGVLTEFSDPKGTSHDKKEEITKLMTDLQERLASDPHAFQ